LSYAKALVFCNSYGKTSLYNAVKNNKITGVTDADIDELFALFISTLMQTNSIFK